MHHDTVDVLDRYHDKDLVRPRPRGQPIILHNITSEQFIADIVSLQPAMRHLAMQILRDDDLANDAVQETFVHLWHHRWRIALIKDKRNFCLKALRNQCIDMLRKRDKRMETPLQQEDNDRLMEEEAENHEQRFKCLDEAIKSLPPQQQRLIEMKYVERLSIREIAQKCGLSETNVTTILSRAYKTLKEVLENKPDINFGNRR